ncbi:class I SAM-dependent methyltransferase [Porticoccus sp.]|uniref:class I SAM-dependent methyltransferase n=1 Tax=Porticoccus sp. TaxID=2024853 RepID=UPI000C39D8C9|nr:class I SAM-dependent methyltransferase [Porticoccus sp.]MAZ69013.1 SAM-dependent methyltransferase [Porticoccus sp.]|tara:strand:- start:3191 stop:3949 length:759 start_codon:yes stop_codon:yes gene_type:complete
MTNERQPFQSRSFPLLAEAEAGHWWFLSRNRLLLWVLAKKVGSFRSFLEVGCGTGFVLRDVAKAFPETECFGSEYFEEGLVFARARVPTATFRQIDATRMTESEHYDVIGAFDVIEHIEPDQLVLANLARAMKPNGALLLTVPQHRWLWSEVDQQACHVRRYTRNELIFKVSQAGLSVSFVTSFVSLLLPLMWLARSRAKANSQNCDSMSELRLPGWINCGLEAVMRLELFLIKLGIRLPVGGSLLLLARKP